MYDFDDTELDEAESRLGNEAAHNDSDGEVDKTGTTTVAVSYEDGAVVAADRQTTTGFTATSHSSIKIHQVHPTAVLTTAGLVADMQRLTDLLQSRASLFEVQRGTRMKIPQLAKVASNTLYMSPKRVGPILAGVDEDGTHIVTLDAVGGLGEGPYKATGSGRTHAYGVLDDRYEEDMTHEEARELARAAVSAARERDIFTGHGLVVATVTAGGVDIEEYDAMPEENEL